MSEAEDARARRKPKGGWRAPVTLLASAFVVLVAGSGWLALYPPVPVDLGGVPNLDARAERVSIPVGAGDHLDGWLLRGRRDALVVVFHGYGRDHTRAWRYGQFLNRAGYSVLAANFRSSRAANREPTTLGYYEMEDARAELDWVAAHRALAAHGLALFGESLGASVALTLASERPEVQAVVVDCPFADGKRAVEGAMQRFWHLPKEPFATLTRWMGEAVTGHDPYALEPLAACARLRDRPIFFIHSVHDDRLGVDQSEDLWRAAGGKDSLWVVPDGGHTEAWLHHRVEYERRVIAFLDRALATGRR